MSLAPLAYILCAISGIVIERRLGSNSLLKRTLMVTAVAAAQLMTTIEALSLWMALRGGNLLLLNLAVTVMALGLAGRRGSGAGRIPWRQLASGRWREFRDAPKGWLTVALFFIAAGLFGMTATAAWLLVPYNDPYHFEMPLFWIQRETVLPFPVNDPRIVALSFLSEALQLPGYYARWDSTPAIAAIVTGLLVLWVIFSLARRIGASVTGSACATAIATGYTSFAMTLQQTGVERFLAGAFFGGSVIFLLDFVAAARQNRGSPAELGCSVFLFSMACGAKNSTLILALVYLGFLGLAVCSVWSRSGDRFKIRGMAIAIMASGLAGLICSGVAWNYTSNKVWFGQKGLPQLIAGTVTRDWGPREIWTRICRGSVMVIYDTTWVPKAAREKYVAVSEKTVRLLGGKATLPEDEDFYSFKPAPLEGLGLLGVFFFVPGLILACATAISAMTAREKRMPQAAFNTMALALFAIAAFAMCHLILRWQPKGMLHLMFPFVAVGAPLAAVLLEKRWLRAPALALLILTGGMCFVYWMGHISRRYNVTDKGVFKMVARLQNDHSVVLRSQWKGEPERPLRIEEDYSSRELHRSVLKGLEEPCTIGFVGHGNSDCFYLFGTNGKNRVVPLVDCREEEKILDLSGSDLDYVVSADKFAETRAWAQARGFEEILTVSGAKGEVILAFKKNGAVRRALQ